MDLLQNFECVLLLRVLPNQCNVKTMFSSPTIDNALGFPLQEEKNKDFTGKAVDAISLKACYCKRVGGAR
jgi:hypothetical protein